mmetsp:Transcript_450/g.812  ORF Transcript_450/g.812 Transcript_450/m.812 type:complete len:106 (+) Transcript_450:70-387(+)
MSFSVRGSSSMAHSALTLRTENAFLLGIVTHFLMCIPKQFTKCLWRQAHSFEKCLCLFSELWIHSAEQRKTREKDIPSLLNFLDGINECNLTQGIKATIPLTHSN